VPELDLTARLQAVLFVATEPLSTERLAEATGASAKDTLAALAQLEVQLASTGLRLGELDGKYRLITAPEAADTIRRFLREEANSDLSRPALETLAIVAYRGPLTKSAIEAVRGVASDTMLRNLLSRGLITEVGKSSEPGRPVLYSISQTFLQHFGLTSLRDLPPIPEVATEA
jgi:segregation and condensation protein B